MHSLRTRITLLTVCAVMTAMTAATCLGVAAVKNIGSNSSQQLLRLLCETGEKTLDSYFQSVEQSVEMVSSFVASDLEETDPADPDQLSAHMDRASAIFRRMAEKTSGVLTYYYRPDPAASPTEAGFWYISRAGEGFAAHDVTDITRYDTADTSRLVWFTVPKASGRPAWLPPYITDNLDAKVLSYNVPIYRNGVFFGIVGIEIDYATIAEQVDRIRLYDNGYAFIVDEAGSVICHPYLEETEDNGPAIPEGLLSADASLRYRWEGVEKQAAWLPLHNGMRLYVTVPMSELNGDWQTLIGTMIAVSLILLILFTLLTMNLTGFMTRPLAQLTKAAEEVNDGNYDIHLDYHGSDEIGILTGAFRQLASHLKNYIRDLNSLAYADALTAVRNKGAYDIYLRNLQAQTQEGGAEFAVGVFDCDNLKGINDRFGHEKGDIYLKTASALICRVFEHNPVFRTGGDEFTVLIEHEDYRYREERRRAFEEASAEICAQRDLPWEQVRVSLGIAAYDPATDHTVEDTVRRADQLMYENKRRRKAEYRAAAAT